MKLHCPPDKSLTHRALLLAGMATGTSTIKRPNLGADCRATLHALQALGCVTSITDDQQSVTVISPGMLGWDQQCRAIDCGNSGTTARLLLGVLSACPGVEVIVDGDESLRQRPMRRLLQLLEQMGGEFIALDGARGSDRLPLKVIGKNLRAMALTSSIASAQIKSAVLLAGTNCIGSTSISLPAGGRDHTERMLRALAVPMVARITGEMEEITVRGPATWPPLHMSIAGDPSAAAFWVVWSILHGRGISLPDILLNPLRLKYLEVLRRLGAIIRVVSDDTPIMGEETGTIELMATKSKLSGVEVTADEVARCIDEIPILAVAAAFAQGESRFRGCGELRYKESDRLAGIISLLHAAGASAAIEGDDLLITGGLVTPETFAYTAHKDHRLVMAAAILGTMAAQPPLISDPAAVAVSYPGFFDVLASLR